MTQPKCDSSRSCISFLIALLIAALTQPAIAQSVFVNELHYDNASTDVGEAIEIAGPSGTDLAGWSIVLYNGSSSSGTAYNTNNLSGVIPDQGDGFGTLFFSYPTNGIQNGSPDGIALVNGSTVVQFISYEGSFTAVGGAANGMTSIDIGVSESSSTVIGDSLQLTGSGGDGDTFTWTGPLANSFGAVNAGQTFTGEPGGGGGGGEPPSGPDFVINELHADPASGDSGDANGDGTRDFSNDEFIELVNTSGSDIDVSGWTLADGAFVRHTFPQGSVVQSQCAVVVFGGGTPQGSFGGSLLQTATSGAVGLNNSGDTVTLSNGTGTVTASYGSAGGNNQSLTLDPDISGGAFVQHSAASNSGGSLFSPGTRIDGSQFTGCDLLPQGPFEIFELQGDGQNSPWANVLIETRNNTVTALGTDGFFMQTPDARADSDVNTSNGIFVFTNAAPAVSPGDQVDVIGQVREFFGFTEITGNPQVSVLGSGAPLPAAVVFDASVPSPDPTAPSCAIEFECYEGMLLSISNGTVAGGNQRFSSDTVAEVHITAASERPFREPGVEFPGLGDPSIATWDGNPEIFELDPDKLGLDNLLIAAGSHFDATGVLGFEFGGYELWPSSLSVTPAPQPAGVRERERAELTIGSLNLFRLFDNIDDPEDFNPAGGRRNDFVVSQAEYDRRRGKFVDYVLDILKAPDVLAVQEAEKLGVLEDLAASISVADSSVAYTAYLVEGNDIGTIDVGFLVRDTVAVDAVTQLGKEEILDFDGSLLNDRPPLLLEGRSVNEGADYPFAAMVVHNRSLSGIDSSSRGERVRAKRLAQAQSIAAKVQAMQTGNPALRLVIVGDFNAFEFSDGFVDAVGQISGMFEPGENLLSGDDLVDPDLINHVRSIAAAERYSFVFRGSAQALDHALASMSLDMSFRGLEFGRGNADSAVDLINDDSTVLRASDHDGLVLFITKDVDADGVNDDADVCPATVIPELPSVGLGTNRFALVDDDFSFDTVAPNGVGPRRSYSTTDTAGCSCAQIVAAEDLGKGHEKFGCSIEVMDNWVQSVN